MHQSFKHWSKSKSSRDLQVQKSLTKTNPKFLSTIFKIKYCQTKGEGQEHERLGCFCMGNNCREEVMYQRWEKIWACWSAVVEGVGAVVSAASWAGRLLQPNPLSCHQQWQPAFPAHWHMQNEKWGLGSPAVGKWMLCWPQMNSQYSSEESNIFSLFFTKLQMERLKKLLMIYLVASGKNKMCTSCLKAMPLPTRPPLRPTDIAEELHWMSHQ